MFFVQIETKEKKENQGQSYKEKFSLKKDIINHNILDSELLQFRP